MEITQNVTLAIPRHILRKAKILAVQKNTSLSGLLTQTLIDLVANQENFEQARQRSLAMLKTVSTSAPKVTYPGSVRNCKSVEAQPAWDVYCCYPKI